MQAMNRDLALIYVRKSFVRTRSDEISPERQRQVCIAYCETRGWRHEVYEDAEGHRSGRSEVHRPAWRLLKAQLARPEVAAVVVASLDRSSRSPADFFKFLDDLHTHGVELVSLKEQFDTSNAIGRAFVAILMVIAALESDLASERVKATVQYLRAQGRTWGIPPFGYRRDKDNGHLLAPDANAPAAIACLETYAAHGSYTQTAQRLNDAGLRFRDRAGEAVPFTKDSVRSIISALPAYLGYTVAGHNKDLRLPADGEGRVQAMLDACDAFRAGHEPLIDYAVAEGVLAMRQAAQRRRENITRARTFPLSTLLVCAECGATFRGAHNHGRPVYRHNGKPCGTRLGSYDAETLERSVIALIARVQLPDEIVDELRKAALLHLREHSDYEAMQQIARLRGKLDRLKTLYLEGDIPKGEYEAQRDRLREQIEELQGRVGPVDYDPDRILTQLDRWGALLEHATLEQREVAFTSLFDEIAVGLSGTIKKVVPADWLRPLLQDLSTVIDGLCTEVPPRDSRATCVHMCRLPHDHPVLLLARLAA